MNKKGRIDSSDVLEIVKIIIIILVGYFIIKSLIKISLVVK